MSEWLFLGERTEAGLVFQQVIHQSTGQHYRFEPIATKLRGNFAGILRQEVEKRRKLVDNVQEQAIIPVIGPIFYEGRYWLGWKERNGRFLFEPAMEAQRSLGNELAALYPLICSYCLWHQAGLVVGRPVWTRLSIDNKGVFMPDPKILGYLARPYVNPPIALERSHTAEEYQNQPLGFAGDIFYLGLIIYYYLTGKFPFPLDKDWPTKGIINGAITNPHVYSPNLHPELGRMILSMLVPEPLQRPTADMVKELWDDHLIMKPILLKSDFVKKPQRPANLDNRHFLSGTVLRWVFPFGVLVSFIIAATVFYWNHKKHSNSSLRPLTAATKFYQAMGRINLSTNDAKVAQSLTDDFKLAAKHRLEMITALLSKPIFKVERMKLIAETQEIAIVEADLTWWEWSGGVWKQRLTRERLYFQKKRNQLHLRKRTQLH